MSHRHPSAAASRAKASPRSSWARLFVGFALSLALIETAFLHGFGSSLLGAKNPLLRARGWAEIARETEQKASGSHPDFWIANDYAVASEIAFYTRRKEVFIPNFRKAGTQFALWPGYQPAPRGRALYISRAAYRSVPGEARPEWELLLDLERLMAGESPVRTIEGLFNQMAGVLPAFAGVTWASLGNSGVRLPM